MKAEASSSSEGHHSGGAGERPNGIGPFDPELPGQTSLRQRSVRGGMWTMAAQAVQLGLHFLSVVVLSRLLAPSDFGLVAMVTTLTAFVHLLRSLGLVQATIQRPQLSSAQISNLFWINLTVCFMLGVLIAAASPAIGLFYNEPRVVPIAWAIAGLFFIAGFSIQHHALLQRRLMFRQLATVQVIPPGVSLIAAVCAALAGLGDWALEVQMYAAAAARTALVWWYASFLPRLPKRHVGTRSMVVFGANLSVSQFGATARTNLDNILIGRVFGEAALGLYTRAYALMVAPTRNVFPPVSSVATPVLSRVADDPARYRRAFLILFRSLATLVTPLVAVLIVLGDWVVLTVLGERWAAAAPLFQALAPLALVMALSASATWLFVTRDKTRELLRWSIWNDLFAVATIALGLLGGPLGVALSYSLTGVFIRTPVFLWYSGRHGPVRTSEMYRAMLPGAVGAAAGAAAAGGFRFFQQADDPISGVVIGMPIGIAAAFAAIYAVPSGRRWIADVRSLVRDAARGAGDLGKAHEA